MYVISESFPKIFRQTKFWLRGEGYNSISKEKSVINRIFWPQKTFFSPFSGLQIEGGGGSLQLNTVLHKGKEESLVK